MLGIVHVSVPRELARIALPPGLSLVVSVTKERVGIVARWTR